MARKRSSKSHTRPDPLAQTESAPPSGLDYASELATALKYTIQVSLIDAQRVAASVPAPLGLPHSHDVECVRRVLDGSSTPGSWPTFMLPPAYGR